MFNVLYSMCFSYIIYSSPLISSLFILVLLLLIIIRILVYYKLLDIETIVNMYFNPIVLIDTL